MSNKINDLKRELEETRAQRDRYHAAIQAGDQPCKEKMEAIIKQRDEARDYGDDMRCLTNAARRVTISYGEVVEEFLKHHPKCDEECLSAGCLEDSLRESFGKAQDARRSFDLMWAGLKTIPSILCSFFKAALTNKELVKHMEECEKHPMAALKKEKDQLRSVVAECVEALKGSLHRDDSRSAYDRALSVISDPANPPPAVTTVICGEGGEHLCGSCGDRRTWDGCGRQIILKGGR